MFWQVNAHLYVVYISVGFRVSFSNKISGSTDKEKNLKFINAAQTVTVQQIVLESDQQRSSRSSCNCGVTTNCKLHNTPVIRLTARLCNIKIN